jgi:23S rRNA (uracil1939-C5)-methyltransferase
MQVSYEGQLQAKRENVVEQLVRIGKKERSVAQSLVGNTVASKHTFNYRNKIELHASFTGGKNTQKNHASGEKQAANQFKLGFHQPGSNHVVETKTCPIAAKALEKAPGALRGALRYAQGNQDLGIFRVGIRHSATTKATEVALWTKPGAFPRARVASIVQDCLKTTSVVRVLADPGKARKIKGVEVLSGKGYWEEKLLGLTYKVSAPSFFQVNTPQAETMIKLVLEGLAVNGNSICADLYCGAGTFTLPLAQHAEEVFAVESAASSVRDLRRNLELNNSYAEVIGGDSARELPLLGELDGLVVDPPRVGLAPSVAHDIAQAGPLRFAYVSCNPSTWARDVCNIEAEGYRLISATPVDLFPQTYHVETVSIFEKC